MSRAWSVAILFVPFVPTACIRDMDTGSRLVPSDLDKETMCPVNYTPENFECFKLPRNRIICGMARPTADENCECGVYKILYKRKDQWKNPAAPFCDVIADCNERFYDMREEDTEAKKDVCWHCKETKFKGCYKYHVLSQHGSVQSIIQHAGESLKERRRALYPGSKELPVTLISLDSKEVLTIKLVAESIFSEHNVDFVIEDFTSPTKEKLSDFVELVMGGTGDVIVHCGGGMGRTGVFLIALVTRLVLEERVLKQSQDSQKLDPIDPMVPIDQATRFVQNEYHPDAGEFVEVPTNLNVLLELVKWWVQKTLPWSQGVSADSAIEQKRFFAAYKARCLKIKIEKWRQKKSRVWSVNFCGFE